MRHFILFILLLTSVSLWAQQPGGQQKVKQRIYGVEVETTIPAEKTPETGDLQFREMEYTSPQSVYPYGEEGTAQEQAATGNNNAVRRTNVPPPPGGTFTVQESKFNPYVVGGIALGGLFLLFFIIQVILKYQDGDKKFGWKDYSK